MRRRQQKWSVVRGHCIRGKATEASTAVVALLDYEAKQHGVRGYNVILTGLAESKAGESDEDAVTDVLAAVGIEATAVKKDRQSARSDRSKPAPCCHRSFS
jgi:hypothetical protein